MATRRTLNTPKRLWIERFSKSSAAISSRGKSDTGGRKMDIPDAPWIEETMRTGYCRSGWWNNPPEDDFDEYEQEDDIDDED
jgi:hypothetical protein